MIKFHFYYNLDKFKERVIKMIMYSDLKKSSKYILKFLILILDDKNFPRLQDTV